MNDQNVSRLFRLEKLYQILLYGEFYIYCEKPVVNYTIYIIMHVPTYRTYFKYIGPYKYLAAQKSRYLVHILELEADLSSIKTFDNYTFGAKRTTAKN